MCGRYTLATPVDDLVEVFHVGHVAFSGLTPRYNLAPTQDAPVIIADAHGGRRMGMMRWGLVPSWADDPSLGNRLINARAETVAEKPAFRAAFRRRRCVVPMDGFYEWVEEPVGDDAGGETVKVPHWIHRPERRAFGVAGLWERWREDDGADPLVSFTLLTTRATPFVRRLHDRMPLILSESGVARWLDPESDSGALDDVLSGPPETELEERPVSREVNAPRNDHPGLIEPAE
jgi:putative SOS response-associated peptidase YedK